MLAHVVACLISDIIALYHDFVLRIHMSTIVHHCINKNECISLSRVRLETNLQTQLLPLFHLISVAISLESTEHCINSNDYNHDKISTLDQTSIELGREPTTQFSQSLWRIRKFLELLSILEAQKRMQFIICTNQLTVGYSGNIVCISVYLAISCMHYNLLSMCNRFGQIWSRSR